VMASLNKDVMHLVTTHQGGYNEEDLEILYVASSFKGVMQ